MLKLLAVVFWPVSYIYGLNRNISGLRRSWLSRPKQNGVALGDPRLKGWKVEVTLTLTIHIAVMLSGLVAGLTAKYAVATIPATVTSLGAVYLVGLLGSLGAHLPKSVGLPLIVVVRQRKPSEESEVGYFPVPYSYEAWLFCDVAFWCIVALLGRVFFAAF
ncbi:MAG TPA: hypothetical protein VNG90_00985 [Candidatus Acidoferrum sp.]|nr:hypothetical protein [Candidatus Acidoferrum sp.]